MLTGVQARRMKPTDQSVTVGGVPGLMLFSAKRPGPQKWDEASNDGGEGAVSP